MGAIVITTNYIYHKIIPYNDLDVYTFYQGLKATWSIIQYILVTIISNHLFNDLKTVIE